MSAVTTLAAAILLAAPVAALAQEGGTASGADGAIAYEALGQRLTFPLPTFFDIVTPFDALQQFKQSNDNEALLELLPEEQNFESWGQLYWGRMALDPKLTADYMREFTFQGFSEICKPEQTYFFTTAEDDAAKGFTAPLAYVCGEHADGIGLDGLGEMMVTVYRQSPAGVAVVTMEWRGPKFDVTDKANWPISGDVLVERATQIDAATQFAPVP